METTYRKLTLDLLLCHQQEVSKCTPVTLATKPGPYETPRHYTFTWVAFIAPPVKFHFLLVQRQGTCTNYVRLQSKTQLMHKERGRKCNSS